MGCVAAGLRRGAREAKVGRTEDWTEALIARGTLSKALRDMVSGRLRGIRVVVKGTLMGLVIERGLCRERVRELFVEEKE